MASLHISGKAIRCAVRLLTEASGIPETTIKLLGVKPHVETRYNGPRYLYMFIYRMLFTKCTSELFEVFKSFLYFADSLHWSKRFGARLSLCPSLFTDWREPGFPFCEISTVVSNSQSDYEC